MANEPWTEEEEAVASQVEQTALRSSSAEVEALASAPWSAEEEEAVRMVEMRAMGVQAQRFPATMGVWTVWRVGSLPPLYVLQTWLM